MSDVDALQLQKVEVEPTQTVCGDAFHSVQTVQKFLFTFTVRSERVRTSNSHNNKMEVLAYLVHGDGLKSPDLVENGLIL